jgi:hypothetical protein
VLFATPLEIYQISCFAQAVASITMVIA